MDIEVTWFSCDNTNSIYLLLVFISHISPSFLPFFWSISNHNNMPPRNESSAIHSCDLCKRKKVTCNGERPCANCFNRNECKYTTERYRPTLLASSNPQSRRLSSGSACETCRRRKTKCDGQQPCNYCSTNGIECLNNSERRKRGLPPVSVLPMKSSASHKRGQSKRMNNFVGQKRLQPMSDHRNCHNRKSGDSEKYI